jgi:hypothetical protein
VAVASVQSLGLFADIVQIAAGLKELQIESAFTHLAKLEEDTARPARATPVERSGGGA